jgi:hypothetical protein
VLAVLVLLHLSREHLLPVAVVAAAALTSIVMTAVLVGRAAVRLAAAQVRLVQQPQTRAAAVVALVKVRQVVRHRLAVRA